MRISLVATLLPSVKSGGNILNGVVKLMVNVKEQKLGQNTRKSFAKNQFPCELPSLVEVQTKSFKWFLEEGLKEVLEDVSPISA